VLGLTVKIHKGSESEDVVQIDTTVQEKNITFPTDTKLQMRIIEYIHHIAKQENIRLRQSYKFVIKKLRLQMHNGHLPARIKQASKARKKLKILCGRLLRDLERKLSDSQLAHYKPYLDVYHKVLAQRRKSKNKIYSLHELDVYCIAKGKAHKKYEFGCKVSVVRNAKSGVITGIKSYAKNIYDGHTLQPALEQCQRIRESLGGKRPEKAVVDRGCRGPAQIDGTQILIPGKPKADQKISEKRALRKLFRARAAIEPVIGHVKQDHRMGRNFLAGIPGDAINAIMAGAAFHLKLRINQLRRQLKNIFVSIYHRIRKTLWPDKLVVIR